MKTGIITIVVGTKYAELFDRYSRARFEDYARRHGYEARVQTEVIRELPGKKLTWQKCCLHDLEWVRGLDRVAFLDADIIISKDAPALPDVPDGKIGGAMDKPPAGFNSGVLVFRPSESVKALFDEALPDPDPFWDQVALDRVLRAHDALHLIDSRFHCMFYVRSFRLIQAVLRRNWFYHALHGKKKLALIEKLLLLQRR